MPKDYPRSERVADQIQRELADIIRHELKDPGVSSLITIAEVEVSRDLSIADVYFTVLENDKIEATGAALARARGFLRSRLGSKLRIRSTPQLRFFHDESTEQGARIDRLIAEARERDNASGEDS